jgi:hypothetical protein
MLPAVGGSEIAVSGPPSLHESHALFEALSHEVRRHIVQVLAHYGPELPSGYLAQLFSHT